MPFLKLELYTISVEKEQIVSVVIYCWTQSTECLGAKKVAKVYSKVFSSSVCDGFVIPL